MNRILEFAREQVGKPYKLNCAGPDLWDCSGLVKMAVKKVGLSFYHGATTSWNRGFEQGDPKMYGYWERTGTIETMPTDVVAYLYNQDKSRTDKLVMAHTGIYDPVTGRVIQAGGQYPGVSDKPINRNRWSHWATLQGTGGRIMVYRKGSQGQTVIDIQKALMAAGFALLKFGADGKYGQETEIAVMGFQRNNNIEPTGVVDEVLLAKLMEYKPVQSNAYAVRLGQIADELKEIAQNMVVLTK